MLVKVSTGWTQRSILHENGYDSDLRRTCQDQTDPLKEMSIGKKNIISLLGMDGPQLLLISRGPNR